MLYDAVLDRLEANVPLQEAGRISGKELTLSRANRSARLFDHVVDCLAGGRQPDVARLADTEGTAINVAEVSRVRSLIFRQLVKLTPAECHAVLAGLLTSAVIAEQNCTEEER